MLHIKTQNFSGTHSVGHLSSAPSDTITNSQRYKTLFFFFCIGHETCAECMQNSITNVRNIYLHVGETYFTVFYGCEIFVCHTKRGNREEAKVQRRICGRKRPKLTGKYMKLHS
jgi:hypothetical protein